MAMKSGLVWGSLSLHFDWISDEVFLCSFWLNMALVLICCLRSRSGVLTPEQLRVWEKRNDNLAIVF